MNETGWRHGEERAYSLATPGNHAKYRLVVGHDNDSLQDVATLSIGQMKLLSAECQCDQTPLPLVPAMTGVEDEAGIVSASGALSDAYSAWHVFDQTGSLWLSEQEVSPAWIGYQFKDGPRHVTQYSLTYTNGSLTSRAPKDFSLQGYNGESWITLDSRSNQTGWSASGESRIYDVASPGDYSEYRLNITQDNDSRAAIIVASVGKFQLLGHSCVD
jgi:hypothetical protein